MQKQQNKINGSNTGFAIEKQIVNFDFARCGILFGKVIQCERTIISLNKRVSTINA